MIFKAIIAALATLVLMVIVFLNTPRRFVSYLTCISPFSPGAIGALGFFGIVHPQLDFTPWISIGASPIFSNINVRTPSLPFKISP